ncbi:helix-turn-helix transcriptional regulator [Myxococcota bacterium]|nr:helix-turn-helix transcriptional regulator [Myxococcota bacterium]MBU1534010.1 helix-turn-helix transcriptional regulator [Myxococcota bacterium]
MGSLRSKLVLENRIHVFRAIHKITQQQLADATGVTRATIVALEKGNYNPSLDLAFRLALYFQVDINELFIVKGERDEHLHEN